MLNYDPETGVFTWKVKPSRRVRVGATAGCQDKDGYWQIKIEGRLYFAHRLAWLIETGSWPEHSIDHIDGARGSNKFSNLRDVAQSQNMQNQRRAMSTSKSGLLGVISPQPGKRRFAASINTGGKQRRIGWFDTAEAAHEAYIAVKRVEHISSAPGA